VSRKVDHTELVVYGLKTYIIHKSNEQSLEISPRDCNYIIIHTLKVGLRFDEEMQCVRAVPVRNSSTYAQAAVYNTYPNPDCKHI